jgi:hypothetical protein
VGSLKTRVAESPSAVAPDVVTLSLIELLERKGFLSFRELRKRRGGSGHADQHAVVTVIPGVARAFHGQIVTTGRTDTSTGVLFNARSTVT